MRNSKAWFEEHRAIYQSVVRAPQMALAEALLPKMLLVDEHFQQKPVKHVSRIYRDVRFSKDKSLFRDVAWVMFMREKTGRDRPAFFIKISPDGFWYGCGYYDQPRETMKTIREMIQKEDPIAMRAMEAAGKQHPFEMEGACYVRRKFPDAPESSAQWLERKGICFTAESTDFELLFSEHLADTLYERWKVLHPIYEFFCTAEKRAHGSF